MGDIFLDSFDHYLDAHALRKWNTVVGAISSGRTNNGFVMDNGFGALVKNISPATPSITMGVAIKYNAGNSILSAYNSNDTSRVPEAALKYTGDGRLRMVIGNIELDPIPNLVLHSDSWYYTELSVSVSGSDTAATGFSVRLNNALMTSGTHVSTNGYTGTYTSTDERREYANVKLSGPNRYDDFYAAPSGSFLGDGRIYVLRPNGDHATSDWTTAGTSTGTNDYNYINDTTPDDNTGYLTATASGNTEFTEIEDISGFSGSIKALQAVWCIGSESNTTMGLLLDGTGTGGTHTCSSIVVNTTYTYNCDGYVLSPFTGSAWTSGEVNAVKQGIKLII